MKVFIILVFVSIALIVAGFVVPPQGIIDPSVLTAVGELFGFAALEKIPAAIQKGGRVKVQHGQTTIEAEKKDNNQCDLSSQQ